MSTRFETRAVPVLQTREVTVIVCDRCGHEEAIMTETRYPIAIMFSEGWVMLREYTNQGDTEEHDFCSAACLVAAYSTERAGCETPVVPQPMQTGDTLAPNVASRTALHVQMSDEVYADLFGQLPNESQLSSRPAQ